MYRDQIYKDIIIQIALKLETINIFKLSLCCKKYYEWVWDNKLFWRNKIQQDFGIIDDNKNTYVLLEEIKEKPQFYYVKSLHDKDEYLYDLIPKVFNVYFPIVGITDINDPDYFGVCDFDIISKHSCVPAFVPNIGDVGDLTLAYYSKAIGIIFYPFESREDVLPKIKNKLYIMGSVFNIGDNFNKNDI